MSWYIDPSLNKGYPFNDDFPSSFITDWTSTSTIPLPAYSWRILEGVNNGYPFTGLFPSEFNTDWYASRDLPLPYAAWRIEEGVNNGYPTQGWKTWGDNAGSGGENAGGGMVIGGSKTNYPNGFVSCNRGGIRKQFDNRTMREYGNGSAVALSILNNAMQGRQFFINGLELVAMLSFINNQLTDEDIDIIAKLYGVNIYDGFLCCKVYPFNMDIGSEKTDAKMFGRINMGPYYPADSCQVKLNLGEAILDIKQAWEIESTDYSIYLPFAGTFPLDVRNGLAIRAECWVDLYNGIGEYFVYQNEQITSIHKCIIGVDVPLNLTQGIMNSNLRSNIVSVVSAGLPLLGSVIGGALGGGLGASIGSSAGGLATNALGHTVSHNQVTSPQAGGTASLMSYPRARVIAKIPKMFGDAVGFSEILGENRSYTFEKISNCSGIVQTKNYKCDIIVATEEEKAEIERLMDSGVFI